MDVKSLLNQAIQDFVARTNELQMCHYNYRTADACQEQLQAVLDAALHLQEVCMESFQTLTPTGARNCMAMEGIVEKLQGVIYLSI